MEIGWIDDRWMDVRMDGWIDRDRMDGCTNG